MLAYFRKLLKVKRDGNYRVIIIGKISFRIYSRKYAFLELRDIAINIQQRINVVEKEIFCQNNYNLKDSIENFQNNNLDKFKEIIKRQDYLNQIIYQQFEQIKLNNNLIKLNIENTKKENINIENTINSLQPNSFLHLSAYTIDNAGDNLLVTSLRDLIEKVVDVPITWIKKSIREKLSDETVMLANNTKGIIIGGGGLFLKDTNANDISGWQWPCAINELDKLKVPVYYLGLGYNRFRNQNDFDEVFYNNINRVVEQASFFGMRNSGSVNAIRGYLREELKHKVVFQPCATTVLSKIYKIPPISYEPLFIAVNCAFDRSDMRYGDRKEEILKSIAKSLKIFSSTYKIKYYIHMKSDEEMLPFFDAINLKYECVYLNKPMSTDDFLRVYSSPTLVWAMRGHAQLIPFGCGTPTVSIITHDKLGWFLEDVAHKEWGVDVLDSMFEKKLYETTTYMLENLEKVKHEISIEKDKLWNITVTNLKENNLI